MQHSRLLLVLLACGVGVAGGVAEASPTLPATVRVTLTRQSGISGVQRVNFAVPVPRGLLTDGNRVRVRRVGGAEIAHARRVIARWPDGSVRSIQLQANVDVGAVSGLDVDVGTAGALGNLTLASVSSTLVTADGRSGPKVWAELPAAWLADSQVAGPMLPRAQIAGTSLDAWQRVCDYAKFGVDAFLARQGDKGTWLYDRPTALYRGYIYSGDVRAHRSAYREAAIYRAGITGTGTATRISVPGSASDLKYHYTQGMAIHYLLTGDDRFREAAENVATRARQLWLDPGYEGRSDFWTERNAGFALLAYEWAAAVSDDRAATFIGWADQAVDAYLVMQNNGSYAWEADARCFAHHAEAHGESYGNVGCSPWMSAILADALDAHARRAGGTRATRARDGIVKLGRMIAKRGRDSAGKPYYWMGAGNTRHVRDDYEEHWGEAAYVVAMAWAHAGKSDSTLRTAALALVNGLRTRGVAGQIRSFNWQCRSAVATPWFLQP